jgi:hypothetical protein
VDRCEQCDYAYDELARDAVVVALRRVAREYRTRLVPPTGVVDVGHDLRLRAHPISGVWSALEYACHARDVLVVQLVRVERAQSEDEPEYVPMGRDELVERDRYNEQSPARVADEITASADALADFLDDLDDDGWSRTGIYNYPTREARTVEWMADHTVHELVHHLVDVDDVLSRAGAADEPR